MDAKLLGACIAVGTMHKQVSDNMLLRHARTLVQRRRQAGLLALPNRNIQRVDPYPGSAVAVVRIDGQIVSIHLVDACMQEA